MKNIEPICEAVHKAYCEERVKQGKAPYWTEGDYNRLDEATKDYDRATVRAVQEFMDNLEEEQAEKIIKLEKELAHEIDMNAQGRNKINIDNEIDNFIACLDFDHVIAWANLLDVEVNYPPVDDMWSDWMDELAVEVGEAMRKVGE